MIKIIFVVLVLTSTTQAETEIAKLPIPGLYFEELGSYTWPIANHEADTYIDVNALVSTQRTIKKQLERLPSLCPEGSTYCPLGVPRLIALQHLYNKSTTLHSRITNKFYEVKQLNNRPMPTTPNWAYNEVIKQTEITANIRRSLVLTEPDERTKPPSYMQQMYLWIQKAEIVLSENIEIYLLMLDIIETSQQGFLSSKLFSETRLQRLQQNAAEQYPNNQVSTLNVHTVPVEVYRHSYQLIIRLKIPLYSKDNWIIYHVIPLPIPAGERFLEITDSNPYLISNKNFSTYFALNTIEGVYRENYSYFGQPPTQLNSRTTCESTLLQNSQSSTKLPPPDCKYKLSGATTITYVQLERSKDWLYSTLQPEQVNVTCKNKETTKYTLKDTGVIYLEAQCKLTSKHIVLIGSSFSKPNYTNHGDTDDKFGIIPQVNLNTAQFHFQMNLHTYAIAALIIGGILGYAAIMVCHLYTVSELRSLKAKYTYLKTRLRAYKPNIEIHTTMNQTTPINEETEPLLPPPPPILLAATTVPPPPPLPAPLYTFQPAN